MKTHIFDNYMVIYTGRKNGRKIRVTLEKSKERIAKFTDCWVKTHQNLSLNWIQWTEKILFHIEWLPDGYLNLNRVDLELKMRPVRVDQFRPPLKNDIAHCPIYWSSRSTIYGGRDNSFIGIEFAICLYYPERKIKVTEDLCMSDTPPADPEVHVKKDRVEKASVSISRFKNRDSFHLGEVVTHDETALFFLSLKISWTTRCW